MESFSIRLLFTCFAISALCSLTNCKKSSKNKCTENGSGCMLYVMINSCDLPYAKQYCINACGHPCPNKGGQVYDSAPIPVATVQPEENHRPNPPSQLYGGTNENISPDFESGNVPDFNDDEGYYYDGREDFGPVVGRARVLSTPGVGWTSWSYWSICSVTCGRGEKTRSRSCQSLSCDGDAIQKSSCALISKCIETKPWTRPCRDSRKDCSPLTCSTSKKKFCRSTCGLCYRWTKYGRMDMCGVYNGKCERRRFRHCLLGKCLGLPFKIRTCGIKFCPFLKQWKMWGTWSSCSTSCGQGKEMRTRQCDWIGCSEAQTEHRPCTLMIPCPIIPVWLKWGKWSACSPPCGPGTKSRVRECSVTTACVGDAIQSENCNTRNCGECKNEFPEYCQKHRSSCDSWIWMKRNCKKTCGLCVVAGWSQWSKFSSCSLTCGPNGITTRTRICRGKQPCIGNSEESKDCEPQDDCPEYSQWTQWTPCSESCGNNGHIGRTRTCTRGKCTENLEETKPCISMPDCPALTSWGSWSTCSRSCGGGTYTRRRRCKDFSQCGSEITFQKQGCNTVSCNRFTKCNLKCGGGYRYSYDSSCKNSNVYNCKGRFEGCNYNQCSMSTCSAQYSLVHRYGSTSCCNNALKDAGCGFVPIRESVIIPKYFGYNPTARIINGKVSEKNAWPWMAIFMPVVAQGMLCGGTLIHREWVLTAAHCVITGGGNIPTAGMAVYLGINNMKDIRPKNTISVLSTVAHPQYNFPDFDIALLKIKPVNFNSAIRPACLPKGEKVGLNQKCYATGWGVVNHKTQTTSRQLLEVGLRVLGDDVCKKAYIGGGTGTLIKYGSHKVVCAGSVYERNDTCGGDSGGPLICQRCSSCSWYVAGITSFGPANCGTPGTPGVYTRVSHYENWIYSHIPGLKPGPNGQKSCSSYTNVQRQHFVQLPQKLPLNIFHQYSQPIVQEQVPKPMPNYVPRYSYSRLFPFNVYG